MLKRNIEPTYPDPHAALAGFEEVFGKPDMAFAPECPRCGIPMCARCDNDHAGLGGHANLVCHYCEDGIICDGDSYDGDDDD